MDFTLRIAGEAGQGIQSIGTALSRAVKRSGWNIFVDQDFMSRIRGGNNVTGIRISDTAVYAPKAQTDLLVTLDAASVSLHGEHLPDNAIIIADVEALGIDNSAQKIFDVPVRSMIKTLSGKVLHENSAFCGAIAGILRLSPEIVQKVIEEQFAGKGEEVKNQNVAAFKSGYQYSIDRFASDAYRLELRQDSDGVAIDGSNAVALGAIHAGCKFYAAYPMSPSTGVMIAVARFAKQFGIVVEQAEDEIAAINMIIGASFAGVRAMTGTSGGGFALMGEGLSLAAMTETPLVVVNAQRPGPATGFPTRTEQADLDFLIHAGHGEFARLIYAPGTIEEAFYLTVKAFDMAEKYQVPVLIMTDQHLADSLRNVHLPDVGTVPRTKYLAPLATVHEGSYKRYALTESGISPRALPSFIDDVVYADSDEHTEAGHITEDAMLRIAMVQKRFTRKMALLLTDAVPPTASNSDRATILLIGFGSTFGVMKEASEALPEGTAGFIHFSQVWPFPAEAFCALLAASPDAKLVTVENNAGGQLARLIRRETGVVCHDSILKFDGRPFSVDETVKIIQQRYLQQ